MANLFETVSTQSQLVAGQGRPRVIKTCKTKKDLCLSASAESARQSQNFYLVKFPVRKLPLLAVDAAADSPAIVIDVNSKRKKATHSGFTPKVIVLQGLNSLHAAKAKDQMFCNVWVGEKALKRLHISASDAIGANELQSKLQRLISDKYSNRKASKDCTYTPSPWIREIYPFDSYFIYDYDGSTYKQLFMILKDSRDPSFVGEPVEVFVKYVPEGVQAASMSDLLDGNSYFEKTMQQELTLDKINVSSPALGSIAFTPPVVPDSTYYPAGSELAHTEIRTMLNVKEALAIFLNMLKTGTQGPLKPMFSPVMIPSDRFYISACREAQIVAKEARKNIDIDAFIKWQHMTLTASGVKKKYNLEAAAYAYVGDRDDISTWHLRCDSAEEIKKSLHRIHACDGIPDNRKEAIRLKLKAMYKKATA